jgi:phosphoribosylformylglycinamidine synthase
VHAVSRGGLGVHLAQVAFGGGLGLKVDLNNVPVEELEEMNRNDKILFSESAGRFIVTLPSENQDRFEGLMKATKFACVGTVIEQPQLIIYGLSNLGSGSKSESGPDNDKDMIVNVPINELKAAWKGTFGGLV